MEPGVGFREGKGADGSCFVPPPTALWFCKGVVRWTILGLKEPERLLMCFGSMLWSYVTCINIIYHIVQSFWVILGDDTKYFASVLAAGLDEISPNLAQMLTWLDFDNSRIYLWILQPVESPIGWKIKMNLKESIYKDVMSTSLWHNILINL